MSIPLTFALIGANQVLGLAFSFLVGRRLFAGLVERLTTKRAVILGLVIYTLIPLWGFVLKSQAEFFMIGWLVGTVQGGTQALSRSIYATLTPRAKSGEFFGLYGLSEKFAGILGPLLYGVVGTLTHNPRASIFSISVFFLVGISSYGGWMRQKGAQIAAAEEAQIEVLAGRRLDDYVSFRPCLDWRAGSIAGWIAYSPQQADFCNPAAALAGTEISQLIY